MIFSFSWTRFADYALSTLSVSLRAMRKNNKGIEIYPLSISVTVSKCS